MAEVDPVRLEQVLTNLLDNARKYSPTGGRIEVQLGWVTSPPGSLPRAGRGEVGETVGAAGATAPGERAAMVQIAVRDWGLGVPPERREHIFDRFYQAHAEGSFGGMGLGLFISRQIVELHGGRLELECPCGGGSRFVITLPVGAAATRARVAGTAPPTPSPVRGGS